ncbi:MAG: hypothetical protein B7Z15_07335 [Rhizobiales bacterium 32-66-8]|nr:MAG: hypothetical protein B7Z15_07335 [Rhizobiales bacterium 32-66-8]
MKGTKPRLVVSNNSVSSALRAPAFLAPEAKAEWRRIMPGLVKRRILTAGDLGMVENYCIAVGRVRQLERMIQAQMDAAAVRLQDRAMQSARQLAAELGLTPVSRSRPSIREEGDDDDLSDLDL